MALELPIVLTVNLAIAVVMLILFKRKKCSDP